MPVADKNQLLRRLPSVESVFARPDVQELVLRNPRQVVLAGVRRTLDARRRALLDGAVPDGEGKLEIDAGEVEREIARWTAPALRSVINATGVVVHTNMGRAPLSAEAARAVAEVGATYSNLELDLASGQRGSRMDVIRDILLELTGAEDVLVVNNNAAAVYLALRGLAAGREVIVSRGELVEIGGSFRIPDVMAASGCRLVEVGTTNKTRLDDYRRAVGPETALLLKVHRSNFALVGFSAEVGLDELVGLARECGVPCMMDMGSGTFLQSVPARLGEVPTVHQMLASGVDVVCFSGDKMLGGPQSGILLGKRRLIRALARDPMARALRVGKLTLGALQATLASYRDPATARTIPVVDMLLAAPDALEARAQRLLEQVQQEAPGVEAERLPLAGQVGGGAAPLVELAGFGVALSMPGLDAEELAARLRRGDPPVMTRRQHDRVILDVRTVLGDDQLQRLARAVGAACAGA